MISDQTFWIVTISWAILFVMLARVRDTDVRKARRQYIHAIKEIEYLYKRLNLPYEKPPANFGSTMEVRSLRFGSSGKLEDLVNG